MAEETIAETELGPAGRRLLDRVETSFRLNAAQRELIERAARLADRLEEVDARLNADGLVVADRFGVARPNAMLDSFRKISVAVGDLIGKATRGASPRSEPDPAGDEFFGGASSLLD